MTALRGSIRSSLAGPLLLVLAVALVVGLPTIVLGEIAADDTRRRVRDAELQAQGRAAERVAGAIRQNMAEIPYYLFLYGRNAGRNAGRPELAEALERGDRAAAEVQVQALSRILPAAVTFLGAYDTTGTLAAAVSGGARRQAGDALGLGSSTTRQQGLPVRPESAPMPQLPAAVRDALARASGAITVGGLDAALDSGGKRVPIGVTLTLPSAVSTGFLLAEVDLGFLGAALVEAGSSTGEIYVLDAQGRLLRRLSRSATDPEIGRELSSSALVAALLAGQLVEGDALDPLSGGPQLVATRRIGPLNGAVFGRLVQEPLDLGWHIIAARPVAVVYADVEAAFDQFRLVRILLLGLLLAGTFLLGTSLQQIRRQRQQLDTAGRHKSEFLASMSHELRTPLNAVIGFSDVLLQRVAGPVNEKQAEYLGDIRSSGRHLLDLINDILDLSKIEAGRMELQLRTFSLLATLDSGITMVRDRANEHGITLDLDVTPGVDTITADERKVKQVVANLLSNAVKFTPDGGSVAVHAERRGDEVLVAVQDSGVGIARDDQARIFEVFEQAGPGREAAEGTGLGLALTKKIVELHGGRIWVESELGRGSTFTFALPLASTAAP